MEHLLDISVTLNVLVAFVYSALRPLIIQRKEFEIRLHCYHYSFPLLLLAICHYYVGSMALKCTASAWNYQPSGPNCKHRQSPATGRGLGRHDTRAPIMSSRSAGIRYIRHMSYKSSNQAFCTELKIAIFVCSS